MIRDNNIIFGQDPSQNIAYYATTRPNPDLKWGNLNKPTLVWMLHSCTTAFLLQFDYFVKNSKDQIFNVSFQVQQLIIISM
jgi:hypothetical protein